MTYVALYSKGNQEAHGAIKAIIAKQVVEDLSYVLGIDFYTKPISDEEANTIRGRIENCKFSDSIEKLFERK